jgi:hypothetical protein
MMGHRFVRHDLQPTLALYGIHFAIWVPVALRYSRPEFLEQLSVSIAPLAVCYALSAIWLYTRSAIQRFLHGNRISGEGLGYLPMVHVCLLVTTVLAALGRLVG